MTIRLKILAGCLALTMLTGLLGLYAQDAERRLGAVALDIYDNAFMAVSYLRSAEVAFARISAESHEPGWSAEAAADDEQDMLSDLDVVRDRAMSPAGRSHAIILKARIQALLPHLQDDRKGAEAVRKGFESLVETFAGDAYRYRRGVGTMVARQIRDSSAVIWAGLVLALVITGLVSHLIAPPIRAALRVAQSIAAGKLDTPIVPRGRGETADLLRALAVMQESIAAGIARIKALMDQQAVTHADEIATQHAQMDAALSNMTQGLCLFDAEGRLLVANRRFTEMFAAPPIGASSDDVLRQAGLEMLIDAARDGTVQSIACELPDGRGIGVSQSPVAGGGWVATYEDVTERRAAEARLFHMARHDQLTGLPNRLYFAEHMRAVFAGPRPEREIALLCIDLDRFKMVNDTLGHPAGDALLLEAGDRLRACAGPGALVVRLGGDEFAIVLGGATPGGAPLSAAESQPQAATALAERIVTALAAPFDLQGQRVSVGGSVGIAIGSETLNNAEALLKSADLALYRAKSEGRGVWRFFEADMDLRMQARRELERDLREAVAQEQFEVFYQPLMQGSTGISGFEALVRWRHPERGLVSPNDFIPLAEEVGLIPVIGRWVLQRACADAAKWPAQLKVAVNLSPSQFRGNLAGEVEAALATSGLAPGLLELEITESIMLADEEQVLATLHKIRALGVRIAMDDFGTGYSSLGYLRRFPFDKIKIDQSFVRNMTDRDDCLAIVRAVIGLGRSLGMAVNAEGVETRDQLDALMGEGCLELQGYYFSKPKPAAEVLDMLRRLGCAAEPNVGGFVALAGD
jgi:diguanylate cyclase (GGDEF)-like protein